MRPKDHASLADSIVQAAKGLRTDQMVKVVDNHTPGSTWAGCGKRYIAEQLAAEVDLVRTARMGDDSTAYVWRDTMFPKLLKALKNKPRPEKRSARKKREAETVRKQREAEEAEVNEWVAKGGTCEDLDAEIDRYLDEMSQARGQLERARQARQRFQRMKATMQRMETE